MPTTQFDYIIIGNGLAGLQLALALSKDSFFENKTIALIDKSPKTENDKTWCFWEAGEGQWDTIVSKQWQQAAFISLTKNHVFDLEDYSYKMIHSEDFYKYVKSILNTKNNITFIVDEVIATENNTVKTQNNTYLAVEHIFDSRIPDAYFTDRKHTHIYQHFKGWVIDTEKPVFNTDCFTMMDYRIKHNNDTTFTYVLPLSETKALVEFTFFTPYKVEDDVYNNYLKHYIESILNIEKYTVSTTETGIIPMTDFPFQNYSNALLTKIGTAGGWVKPSTGYAFKLTEKRVATLVANLKTNQSPNKDVFSKKYNFYDRIFLKVLHDNNEKGEWIFEQFYTNNTTKTMFRFLDETSSFSEDLKIMKSLFSSEFIKAFFKTI